MSSFCNFALSFNQVIVFYCEEYNRAFWRRRSLTMATERLVELMQEQLTLQREQLAAQERQYQKQLDEQRRQMETLVDKLASASGRGAGHVHKFSVSEF